MVSGEKMRLTRLEIANFRSIYKPQQEIGYVRDAIQDWHYKTNFRLDFDSGLNILIGPNGAGKSNILDAISFALNNDSPIRLLDNRPYRNGSRSIRVKTGWEFSNHDITPVLDAERKYMNGEKNHCAFGRALHQTFVGSSSTFESTFQLSNSPSISWSSTDKDLVLLEKICTESHFLLHIPTLPQWSTESLRLTRIANLAKAEPATMRRMFQTIICDELELDHTLRTIFCEGNQSGNDAPLNDDDFFGIQSDLVKGLGSGQQAILVYAGVIALSRCYRSSNSRFGMTVLLDEPENGLHSGLQRHLIVALSKLAEEENDVLVVLTTNSPFMLPSQGKSRLFEIELEDGSTQRRDYVLKDGETQRWVSTDSTDTNSMTRTLWDITGSLAIGRALDLFRKFSPNDFDGVLIVEGVTDKLYIEEAERIAERKISDIDGKTQNYQIILAGESLEFRNKNSIENAGAWFAALQSFLTFGWLDIPKKLRVILDGDLDGLQTAISLRYLMSNLTGKVRNSRVLSERPAIPEHEKLVPEAIMRPEPSKEFTGVNYRVCTTNNADPSWECLTPRTLKDGLVLVSTEIEDFWPREYLDQYFAEYPTMSEGRKVSVLTEGSSVEGTNFKWTPSDVTTGNPFIPPSLSRLVLKREAKNPSGPDSFPSYLKSKPPTKEQALIFIERLETLLNKKPSGDVSPWSLSGLY